jgi:soluble lytic murein transglycosylase-like protein
MNTKVTSTPHRERVNGRRLWHKVPTPGDGRFIRHTITGLLFFCTLFSARVDADIYKYIDSQGVMHFTNVPISSGYQLYIKEKPKKNLESYVSNEYDTHILQASKRHGISFPLLKAVIKAESNFNPRAISRKGAKGLMQIMPKNFKKLKIENPYNPGENIMGGASYLGKLIKRYEGKLPLALAAYNAGPSAVDRYKRIPPFTETENYVKKVMKYYNVLKTKTP